MILTTVPIRKVSQQRGSLTKRHRADEEACVGRILDNQVPQDGAVNERKEYVVTVVMEVDERFKVIYINGEPPVAPRKVEGTG